MYKNDCGKYSNIQFPSIYFEVLITINTTMFRLQFSTIDTRIHNEVI